MNIRENDLVAGAEVLVNACLDTSGSHVNIRTDIYGDINLDIERDIGLDHERHHRQNVDTIVVHEDVGKCQGESL